jgi:hypothetical protein
MKWKLESDGSIRAGSHRIKRDYFKIVQYLKIRIIVKVKDKMGAFIFGT